MIKSTAGSLVAFAMGMAVAGEVRGQSSEAATSAPVASSDRSRAGLIPSGVTPISPSLLPGRSGGPTLAPANVPGDPDASLAARQKVAVQVREGRRERVVPVPPTLEIEVLDPNVDPLGNPAVLTARDPIGRTVVDIPPVVLVHRYYYTGDRPFQGPMLPGGPSILVMSHPRSGERLYVEAQMLPGAPRVYYSRSSIEFDYGPQSIALKFGHHGKPAIIYRQGATIVERWHRASESRRERVDRFVERTGVPEAGGKLRDGVANVAGAGADGVRSLGRAVASPVVQLIRSTPIGSVVDPDPGRREMKEREDLTRRAEAEARRFGGDIPTVR